MKFYQIKVDFNEICNSSILFGTNQNDTGFMALNSGLHNERVYIATKDLDLLNKLKEEYDIEEIDNSKILTAFGREKKEFCGNAIFFTGRFILNEVEV